VPKLLFSVKNRSSFYCDSVQFVVNVHEMDNTSMKCSEDATEMLANFALAFPCWIAVTLNHFLVLPPQFFFAIFAFSMRRQYLCCTTPDICAVPSTWWTVWPWSHLELSIYAASAVLCGVVISIVGDSLKQKLDNLSDTVTDNVRGTGTESSAFFSYSMLLSDLVYKSSGGFLAILCDELKYCTFFNSVHFVYS